MKKIAFVLFFLLLLALIGSCTPVEPDPYLYPADVYPANKYPADITHTKTVSVIHTQVAGTMLASAALTPALSAAPTATPPATATRPAPTAAAEPFPTETSLHAAVPTVMVVPTMVDVPLLEGYKSYGSRVLAHPAAVMRDGITVAVEQAAVYTDHVELVYTVRDIPHASLFDPFSDDTDQICGGPESYPNLLLPDGTVIYPESYLLDGKARGMNEPFASSYLIHLYRSNIPEDVQELTMYLYCLELPRLDRAPQQWYVPFTIIPATGGG